MGGWLGRLTTGVFVTYLREKLRGEPEPLDGAFALDPRAGNTADRGEARRTAVSCGAEQKMSWNILPEKDHERSVTDVRLGDDGGAALLADHQHLDTQVADKKLEDYAWAQGLASSTESTLSPEKVLDCVQAFLAALAPDDRRDFLLHAAHGWSHARIARKFGLSAPVVRQRYSRTLRRLRRAVTLSQN
jgi:DNA-directed RNA polymerase specialized sigma24 family protein